MYRLSRIRLSGVGPVDARFDRPSPDAAPFEVSFLGAEGAPEDSVVWLENGGGKTVFLALLFHVLRPDKAAQIGNDEKGRRADLADFVSAKDVAHVVCEWVADDSDRRLLTGLVADRRGTNVIRTWYLLAVRESAVTIDDLVFDIDGRRVAAARYIEFLEQLAAEAGKSGRANRVVMAKTSVQRVWFETLADHDLDPALFEYQVRMNRSEGGATSLFRFSSPEKFVEFFLQLTMNPDTLAALSDELSRVADKVLSLPRKELELAHSTGAVERLLQLATAWSRFEDADIARTDAQRRAELLHDGLVAALARIDEARAVADEKVGRAEAERMAADKQRRESETRSRTVAIALAEARIAAIEAEVAKTKAVEAEATLTADAWPRVNQLQSRSATAAAIAEVRAALEAADEDAAPLRQRRDSLLRALRVVLDAQIRTAEVELVEAGEQWSTADEAERAAQGVLDEAVAAGNVLEGKISEIARRVELHYEAIRAAVGSGLLGAGVAPREAWAEAGIEVASAGAEIERLRRSRHELLGELPELRGGLTRATEDAAATDQAFRNRRDVVATALDERGALAAHPLLAALGAEGVDLELVGADIANRVAEEADRQRASAVAASAATAEDRRAVEVLEQDRLLPARAEVEALCRILVNGGVVSAVPGWRYVVDALPATAHTDTIAAHPALVDGIVVAAHDFDRAQEVLAEHEATAAVLVATGSVLTDPAPPADGWVVRPRPAMHDRSAAEAELDRRRTCIAESDTEIAAVARAERTARDLAAALGTHLDTWPPGSLPSAIAARDELKVAVDAARAALVEARDALEALEAWVEEIDAHLEQERARLRDAEHRMTRLAQLADAADATARAEAEIASLREEQATFAEKAEAESMARAAAMHNREAAQVRREIARQSLDGAGRELAGLPDVGDGLSADAADVTELRAAYETATRLVAEATTDSELSRHLERLEGERRRAEEEWAALDGGLRVRIEELASEPSAVDPVARRMASEEARRAAHDAARAHARSAGRLDVAQSERRALPPPEPTWPVEPFDIPTDLADLERFAVELDFAFAEAREQRSLATERFSAATAERDARQAEYAALAAQAAALGHAVGDREAGAAAPFEGDAAAEVAAALRGVSEANRVREQADVAWHAAASSVGRWARDARWSALTGDLARRLRDDDPEQLARQSADMLEQTRILEARLRDDIAKLDTHRQMLVTSLGDAVYEAARSLRSARKKSELPSGLGDWSHQPFLKIGCEIAEDRVELDSRLRRFTNDLLERASAGLPRDADLVCQALLACAEKAVTVDVLKPNKAQRLRYVPIADTATLSGGMRATAAIAMFCTLTKVRAANRTGRVGVGTLVLDNPLGDANATYLVALQRLVAQMNGVQLVYTTGVNDMDALRLFPVVTRLVNEAAKRSHLAYVVADEAFLKRLAPADGDDAIVTGTRLVRRRQPLLAVDLATFAGDDEDGQQ